MFHVYLLKQDGEVVYIGQTSDLDRRLLKHSRGYPKTSRKTFTDCDVWRSYETRGAALREEARLLKAFQEKYGRLPQYNRESIEDIDERVKHMVEVIDLTDPKNYPRRGGSPHPVGYRALLDVVFRRKEGGHGNAKSQNEAQG